MDTQLATARREKVYFVVSPKHLQKMWPELLSAPLPFRPEACPERILSGRDCWCVQTWARLCAVDCPFEPVLTTEAVDNAVCVFHWDDAAPALGVHRCFAVVAQTDRPAPPLADLVLTQNKLSGEDHRHRFMPHWPQPGLLPRNPARGTRLETLAYFGSDQYEPHFVNTAEFQEALRRRGVRFLNRFQGTWHDYREIDAVLAVRDCPPVVLATKPASKLVNAWQAGTPALLGPEPAYRELRTSPLDFLETPTADAVLAALDRLQNEAGLHTAMIAHGLRRAEAFSERSLTARWIAILEEARQRNHQETRHPLLRCLRFWRNKGAGRLAQICSGWRD